MRVIEEKKMIETTIKTYIAADGKEFSTERDCIEWEKKANRRAAMEALDKFRIREMDDSMPINTNSYPNESSEFRWYRIENEEVFRLLKAAYDDLYVYIYEPKSYPEVICMEDYYGDYYSYNLTDLLEETKSFWANFAYQVTSKEDN